MGYFVLVIFVFPYGVGILQFRRLREFSCRVLDSCFYNGLGGKGYVVRLSVVQWRGPGCSWFYRLHLKRKRRGGLHSVSLHVSDGRQIYYVIEGFYKVIFLGGSFLSRCLGCRSYGPLGWPYLRYRSLLYCRGRGILVLVGNGTRGRSRRLVPLLVLVYSGQRCLLRYSWLWDVHCDGRCFRVEWTCCRRVVGFAFLFERCGSLCERGRIWLFFLLLWRRGKVLLYLIERDGLGWLFRCRYYRWRSRLLILKAIGHLFLF